MISKVAVVIPARNEEARVEACVQSVARSMLAAVESAAVSCTVAVLAADRCEDHTVAFARRAWATVAGNDSRLVFEVLEGAWGSAGGARAAGFRHVLHTVPVQDLAHNWFATTDADTVVPSHWITYQLERANAGVDAVLGTVEPDPRECPSSVIAQWHRLHRLEEGHPYIHAANLGVRGDMYVRAGGFVACEYGEDELLAGALRELGARIESTDRCRAITSGRLRSRVEDGFAGYLRQLAHEASPSADSLEADSSQ